MSSVYLSYDSFSEEQNLNFIDPNFGSLLSYDQSFITLLDDNSSPADNNNWFPIPAFSDETRESKKQKIGGISVFDESLDNNISSSYNNGSLSNFSSSNCDGISRTGSTNSVNSLSAAHFRNHILRYTQQYLANEAAAAAAEVAIVGTEEDARLDEADTGDGMKLVQLLISCAEAVACRDKSHASLLLNELRGRALVFGSSFQRVASCFVQGLVDRLAQVQPLGRVSCVAPIMNIMDDNSDEGMEALSLAYEICPYIQFGHFVANSLILDALEGESFVHIVDLGMSLGLPHGHQWLQLIQSLSNRSGPSPKRVRITGVGLCVERFQVIGEELEACAKSVGLNFSFSYVESNLENLKSEDIKVNNENEIVIVNSILQLHCVVKESRGALNSVLQTIHKLNSKVLVLVEQDSSHNGPFFLGRFMEALHYYSAIFDSLDEMLPKYDTRRAKIEQFYFAEEIKNIVSCEGAARLERHERVDQWRRRMSRAGFQAAPIKLVSQAKEWIGKVSASESYTIVEEKGCLVLGWKSKPIVAASCWKC